MPSMMKPMTFQAYLDTIKAKTGLVPEDFRLLADDRGLLDAGVTTAQVIAWLKQDFGLGAGHAMAIVSTFHEHPNADARLAKQFAGGRARWRSTFDDLVVVLDTHGPVVIAPTDTYVSLLNGSAKFAIVAMTADRLDVGIKLKSAPVTPRFESAGSWNSMVTHRVRVSDPAEVDTELLGWLRRAYDAA